MDFKQNFKVESIKFYKKIIFIDFKMKICRALSQQSSKCITMDFKKWIAFACRFSIILLFYMYLVGTGSYTDRKVILMDVHVFLVARRQGTPIKTIYRKVLFTSLLLKVARKYSFLRIGSLTTASLYSRGKRKLLTWITGSWKSFKPLSSEDYYKNKKPAEKRSSHVDKRWEIYRQESWNYSRKNVILGV